MGIIKNLEDTIIKDIREKQENGNVSEKNVINSKNCNKINDISELEARLKELSIENDNEGKLIARGPISTKDLKSKSTPYQKREEDKNVQTIVLNTHNCGATFYSTNCYGTQSPNITHEECEDIHKCDECLLQTANTPEFSGFLNEIVNDINITKYQNDLKQHKTNISKEIHLNIKQAEYNINQYNLNIDYNDKDYHDKTPPRRGSHDSGIGYDMHSPFSDSVPSPAYNLVTIPKQPFLPQSQEMTKNNTITSKDVETKTKPLLAKSENIKQNETSNKEIYKNMLRLTLNPEVKQSKWVEYLSRKDSIFDVNDTGKTILHSLLSSDEEYIEESFYTIIELMKNNPEKCVPILNAQLSIYKAITKSNHSQLLADYFQEAVEIIQSKLQNKNIHMNIQ